MQRAILDAAAEVLLEHGADQVTAARVAEVADVARTTIYRHWPDPGSLLLATIDDIGAPHYEHTTEGDLEEDLRLTLRRLSARLTQRPTHVVFSALASQAARSPVFAQAQQSFIDHLTAPMQFVLEAAMERGELARSCDCRLQASILVAPVLHRHFMLYEKLTDDLIDATVGPWLAEHCTS